MRRVIKKLNRAANCIIAWCGGYFWLPCSCCGKNFGGHEWRDYNGKYSCLPSGRGICPTCTKNGEGGWYEYAYYHHVDTGHMERKIIGTKYVKDRRECEKELVEDPQGSE